MIISSEHACYDPAMIAAKFARIPTLFGLSGERNLKTGNTEEEQMFYMFHYIPKCGGTSFNLFLDSVFDVIRYYHSLGGLKKNSALFEKYQNRPVDLPSLNEGMCISGHYNLESIFLWQRYPQLKTLPHKKFSVIRKPFATAKSGVYLNIKRGIFGTTSLEENRRRVLNRSNFFAKTLGIRSEDKIDTVLDRYWFIAPLDQIDTATRLIEEDTVRKGNPVEQVNTTAKSKDELDLELDQEFRIRSVLDYAIY